MEIDIKAAQAVASQLKLSHSQIARKAGVSVGTVKNAFVGQRKTISVTKQAISSAIIQIAKDQQIILQDVLTGIAQQHKPALETEVQP
jgi:DNA-binding LacI/PurR family transcriptional regulator